MATLSIDEHVLHLCKQVVSGLDQNLDLVPSEYIRDYGAQEALKMMKLAATNIDGDSLQHGSYFGGLLKNDGIYHFHNFDDQEIYFTLTESEARDIITGKKTTIDLR